jgi:hypothetical protein
MVKRAVNELVLQHGMSLNDEDWAEAKWPHTAQGYRDWALACGRHPELNDGISHLQKKINIGIFAVPTDDMINSTAEASLVSQYRAEHMVALNYLKGIQSLHHETRFVAWLNENLLKTPFSNQLLNTKFVWSRGRDLGP